MGFRLILLALCALFTLDAHAIFSPPPTDRSLQLLGDIFGPNVGSVALGGAAQPVLSAIMNQLNLIVVTIGMLIGGYVTVISVVNTAQEGTVMGKKFSAVWIPMRSILGLGLMIPEPGSGYSLIQATVMWVVINGIGAADTLWFIIVDNLKSGVSASFYNNTVNIDANVTNIKDHAFKAGRFMEDATMCINLLTKLGNMNDPTDGDLNNTTFTEDIYNSEINGKKIQKYADRLTMYVSAQGSPKDIDSGNGKQMYGRLSFGVESPDPGDEDWAEICGFIDLGNSNDDSSNSISIYKNEYAQNPDGTPGAAAENIENDVLDLYHKVKSSVESMVSVASDLTDQLVNEKITPRKAPPQDSYLGIVNSIVDTNDPDSIYPTGFRTLMVKAYSENVLTAIIPGKLEGKKAFVDHLLKQGRDNGWTMASSFYFALGLNMGDTKLFNAVNTALIHCNGDALCTSKADAITEKVNTTLCKNDAACKIENNKEVSIIAKILSSYKTQLENYNSFTKVETATSSSSGGTSNLLQSNNYGDANGINQALASAGIFATGNAMFIDSLSGSIFGEGKGDALLGLVKHGTMLMALAESLWGIIMVAGLATALSVLAVGMTKVLGTGSDGPKVGFYIIAFLLATIVLPLIAFLWTTGATLAIYLPLIPFMIFTVGTLGWVISVIEAIVAAPILALGFVTPAGDELGKVVPGLSIIANLFLRPSLMVLGFLFATKLYSGIVNFVNWGMADNYRLLNNSTMLSWIPVLLMYTAFVVSLTNKCFGLIYILPDRIMRWLGGSSESTDVSQEMAATKKAGDDHNAGKTAANMTSQATKTGAKGVQDNFKNNTAKNKDNAASPIGNKGKDSGGSKGEGG